LYTRSQAPHLWAKGQSVRGWIDLLVKTARGWVIIDHKTHRGKEKELEREALPHSGQHSGRRGGYG
jgi:ATP-dependent exoDNAse (exonuclease V) beta subunit